MPATRRVHRGPAGPAARASSRGLRQRRGIGLLGHLVARVLAPAAQTVIAEIERDAMDPRVELRLAFPPARRLFPDAHEHLLRHVFRFHAVAQHAGGEREQTRQLARDERADGGRILPADLFEQFRVGVAFAQGMALLSASASRRMDRAVGRTSRLF